MELLAVTMTEILDLFLKKMVKKEGFWLGYWPPKPLFPLFSLPMAQWTARGLFGQS